MADTLMELLKRSIKEGVLVMKMPGDDERSWKKNPTLTQARQMIGEHLVMEFSKIDKGDGEKGYVMQFHGRGQSCHTDFRFQIGGGRVSGFLLVDPTRIPDKAYGQFESEMVSTAESVLGGEPGAWQDLSRSDLMKIRDKADVPKDLFLDAMLTDFTNGFRDWNNKHYVQIKGEQDESWYNMDYSLILPGAMGGTRNRWSMMLPFDRGTLEFGASKPDYNELFLYSQTGMFTGRVVVVWLPRKQVDKDSEGKLGEDMWVGFMFTTRESRPYVLSQRAISEGYTPPEGESALPKAVEALLPRRLHYWTTGKHEEAVEWAEENLEFYHRKKPSDVPAKDELWRRK